MPELPEVRALAERLDATLAGRSLQDLSVLGFSSLKTVEVPAASLRGQRITTVSSRGKFLVVDLERHRALVHLGNAGRVDVEVPPKATRPRGAVARLVTDEVGVLVREHGTERRAGLWLLVPDDAGPLSSLGPEPGDDAFARWLLEAADPRRLHTMLRDQHTVCGIGRGYADDALHRAGLSPFASLARLDAAARARLLDAITSVLDEALTRERGRQGGLSAASLGDRFAVHRRAGEPCPRCSRRLERVSYDAYEVVYCPSCQTNGRLLADRRLSRLLR